MEIWTDANGERTHAMNPTGDGYTSRFCEAVTRLRRQRKTMEEIGVLYRKCLTLQRKVEGKLHGLRNAM